MRKISWLLPSSLVVIACTTTACKGKREDAPATGSGSAAQAGKLVDPTPVTCPPGNVVKDGACVVAITPEKIATVAQQQSRIDDLAKLLDNVETVAAPVELMNSFRQTPEWKGLVGRMPKLATFEDTLVTLDGAVKQLRTFKGNLGEASAKLGNLKGELDRLLTDPGTAKQLDEVRSRISSELRTTFEPLGVQVSDTIQKAITPLTAKLEEAGDLIVGTCLIAKSQAGDQVKSLCADARTLFERGNAYVADLKARPARATRGRPRAQVKLWDANRLTLVRSFDSGHAANVFQCAALAHRCMRSRHGRAQCAVCARQRR
jgi:hypothetical protein